MTIPIYTSAPTITEISFSGARVQSTTDVVGTTFFVIVADGATAPTPAEVIAGTGNGGSGELAAGLVSEGTILDQLFIGLSASTAYDGYFISQDSTGTPLVQAAVTKVDFTTTTDVLTATAFTSGLLREGDTIVISLGSTNNASGKTLACSSGAITAIAQDSTSITFLGLDVKTFGDKQLNYNDNITITVTDGGESDTIVLQMSPDEGYETAQITSVGGIYVDEGTVLVDDYGYGSYVAGSGTIDFATGIASPTIHSKIKYWVKSDATGIWSDNVIDTLVDPTGTYVTVASAVTTEGSVFYQHAGKAPVDGDIVIHAATTSPSGIAVTILPSGVWHLASMPTQTETFQAYVLHVNGAYGLTATFTFTAPILDTLAPTLTIPTDVKTGITTGSGTVNTTESGGILYSIATTNTTETITFLKANAAQQNVVASGQQNVTFAGLVGATTYYAHYLHIDSSANESNVSNANGFVTDAIPDVIAPVLSLATGDRTGQETAAGSVTSDEIGGTLYYVITANSGETAATIIAGSNQPVSVLGIQNVAFINLTPGTSYYIHYVQIDASTNESNVVSSGQFTTDSAVGLVISASSTIRLGQVFTVTTTGTYDLTSAISITGTLEGVSLTGLSNVTATTCDFTCPASGLSLVTPSDLIITINI